MEERVKQNLIRLGVKAGDRVSVAVSGGIDSMSLLYCLHNLRSDINLEIAAYHMEHGIRGESSITDMEFVKAQCLTLGIECIVKRVNVPLLAKESGLSIETAARQARYEFLDSADADYIATAHHLGDVAETVIMNLARGSGLCGLSGIPEKRGRYIRPILDISREEIIEYAHKHSIEYVSDETNEDSAYTRNYIRKEIMPRLKRVNAAAGANIARAAKLFSEDEDALMSFAQNAGCIEIKDCEVFINLEKFSHQQDAIKKRILRLAIANFGGLADIENVHIDSLLSLADKAETAKRLDIGRGLFAAVVYNKLMIGKNNEKKYNKNSMTMREGRFSFGGYEFECGIVEGVPEYGEGVEYFDAEAVKGACFRFRKEGDYISPLGLGGTKRLSDYLSDRKMPLHKRDEAVLLARGSEVFWVVGAGVSEKSKVNKGKEVLMIRFGGSGYAQ